MCEMKFPKRERGREKVNSLNFFLRFLYAALSIYLKSKFSQSLSCSISHSLFVFEILEGKLFFFSPKNCFAIWIWSFFVVVFEWIIRSGAKMKQKIIIFTPRFYLFRFIIPFSSVTRLGDFLHFGQLFQACGNN